MIALLLTLFISLFSYCPSVNTIEEHEENITFFDDSNLSFPSAKSMVNTIDNYTIESIDRFCSPSYYIPMFTYLLSLDSEYWSLDSFDGRSYTFSPCTGSYAYAPSWSFYISSLYTGNLDNGSYRNFFPESITITRTHGTFVGSYIRGDSWLYSITFNLATTGNYAQSIGGYVVKDISCNFTIYTNIKDSRNNSILDSRGLDSIYAYLFASSSIGAHALTGQPLSTFNFEHLSLSMSNSVASDDSLGLFLSSDTFEAGYNEGYDEGIGRGNEIGYEVGYSDGYQGGYAEGYQEGVDVDSTASTIFTGILDVALIPVNVFLTIFNFEVFGINIGGIVSGLLTLSVVIIILRFLFGGKKDD